MLVDNLIFLILKKFPDGCVIGITGRGAAGKTTLSKILDFRLNQSLCGHFCLDSFIMPHYVRYNLKDDTGGMMTGYHPNAFKYNDAKRSIEEFIFNEDPSNTNNQALCNRNLPVKYKIIEGVSAMHGSLKGYYDFTIFLDCSLLSEKERRHTRNADIERINYIAGKEEDLFRARRLHYSKYIIPSKELTDISLWSNRNFILDVERANDLPPEDISNSTQKPNQ